MVSSFVFLRSFHHSLPSLVFTGLTFQASCNPGFCFPSCSLDVGIPAPWSLINLLTLHILFLDYFTSVASTITKLLMTFQIYTTVLLTFIFNLTFQTNHYLSLNICHSNFLPQLVILLIAEVWKLKITQMKKLSRTLYLIFPQIKLRVNTTCSLNDQVVYYIL